jgi:hypothetical protein
VERWEEKRIEDIKIKYHEVATYEYQHAQRYTGGLHSWFITEADEKHQHNGAQDEASSGSCVEKCYIYCSFLLWGEV